MPAVSGVDIEVPVITAGPLPVPTPAEPMSVPGAATSGFTTPLEPWTPRDELEFRVSSAPDSPEAVPMRS